MARPLYANNVAGLVSVPFGPSEPLILLGLGDGAKFPDPAGGNYYYATVVHNTTGEIEIVKVTAKAGDQLTVERAQDDTIATSFAAGSLMEMRVTAIMLRELDFRTYFAQPSGLATLDATGKLQQSQIPANIPLLTAGKLDIAVIPDAVALDSEMALKANKAGDTFTGPILIRPAGVAVASPLDISGEFAVAGRVISFVNTSVAVDSAAVILLKAGTSLGSTLLDAAPEYTGIGNFAGTLAFENNNKGISYSTKEATGTHKWYIGPQAGLPAMRELRMSMDFNGVTMFGALAVQGGIATAGLHSTANIDAVGSITTGQDVKSSTANLVLAPNGPGVLYFRPNGAGDATNQATLSAAGLFAAIDVQSTSDRELKNIRHRVDVVEDLADKIELWAWDWKQSGLAGRGPIAQDVQLYAPEYVGKGGSGYLSIDKAGLALATIPGISARLRRIEAALNLESSTCSRAN
jgi:hypothetical protein